MASSKDSFSMITVLRPTSQFMQMRAHADTPTPPSFWLQLTVSWRCWRQVKSTFPSLSTCRNGFFLNLDCCAWNIMDIQPKSLAQAVVSPAESMVCLRSPRALWKVRPVLYLHKLKTWWDKSRISFSSIIPASVTLSLFFYFIKWHEVMVKAFHISNTSLFWFQINICTFSLIFASPASCQWS